MAEDEGASPRELVVEGCRRDQVHLLEEVLDDKKGKGEDIAKFFNEVTDTMGNHCLHICAMYGSYEAMDFLFDIEGFECDPLTRVDRDTPLHVAVRYANEGNADVAREMIEMMCEAGCDPRVKNKHGLKPADLILPHYKDIKSTLQRAEYVLSEEVQNEEAEDEESDGPSDSDEDEAAGNGNAVRNSRR